MRKTIMIGALLCLGPWGVGTWAGGGRKIDRCNAFLTAPEGLQTATRTLLKIRPAAAELAVATEQIRAYVESAPIGSEEVLKYLRALHYDAPESRRAIHTDFNYSVVNMYLMRPGNEWLARKNLVEVIQFYYDDLIDYRRQPGQWAWLEKQTQFIETLTAADPETMRATWSKVLSGDMEELVQYVNLLPILASSAVYLEEYMRWPRNLVAEDNQDYQSGDETIVKKRNRLDYIKLIIAELQAIPPQNDIESLKKLYVIGDERFAENKAYALDVMDWAGESLNQKDAAVLQLVFLTRLSRRLNLRTPEQKRFESYLKRLQDLFPHYPRRVGGPGHIT
jgi:hypothetical protein